MTFTNEMTFMFVNFYDSHVRLLLQLGGVAKGISVHPVGRKCRICCVSSISEDDNEQNRRHSLAKASVSY